MQALRLIVLMSFLAMPPAAFASLADQLDSAIDAAPVSQRTHVALVVRDIESGELLFDRHGHKLFTPASNLKIYTSACALDILGPEHRFLTEVGIDGTIEDGELRGDLVLRASGDPMLSAEDLAELAGRVRKELGIVLIRGSILVDESLFQLPRKGPGWMWDDDPDDYNMSISALMIDFNVLEVVVTPAVSDRLKPPVRLLPASPFPRIFNDAITTGDETAIQIGRVPFTDVVRVRGRIPLGAEPVTRRMTMHDPGAWGSAVFREMLSSHDIRVMGGARAVKDPVSMEVLFAHESVPLADAVHRFNRVSENAIGEMMLHALVVNRGETPRSWSEGAGIISDWLVETAGLEEGSFRLVDGSGLSRYNLITAHSSIDLLVHMWDHPHREVFFNSLPTYEVPLAEDSSDEARRVHAKPGGMSGVSTLSGYIQTLEGRWLAFSYLTNGYIGSNQPVRDLRGELFRILVEWTPDSE